MRATTTDTATATPSPSDPPAAGRQRAVVEAVSPQIDGGRFPVKRVIGEPVVVEADVFADGHERVAAVLRHRPPDQSAWIDVPMAPLGTDRWRAAFTVDALGRHAYTVAGRIDAWSTWRHDLEARLVAGQDVAVDLRIGAALVAAAAERATTIDGDAPTINAEGARLPIDDLTAGSTEGAPDHRADADTLAGWAARLAGSEPTAERAAAALDPGLDEVMARHPDRSAETVHPALEVLVDPVLARFSTWYELFPRSASPSPDRPGTLRDVIGQLDRVAGLGFDVLYLPPIHPIGRTHRKGPNNATAAGPDDPGVPWAIGAAEGGHTAVHSDLGTLEDVRALVAAARERGIAVALDLAFQASPDHPWVTEHPAWFRHRPDGTIQYAENPPKKYEDIYPFDFESADWPGLWSALREVVRFWIDQGIRVFRVDNPHTKPFGFWEWLIGSIKADEPDVLFLAEAFTRPKVMYRLAKLGFSQSYTYFTWRTTPPELTAYFEELCRPPVGDFFRPNAWPNTPDILHEVLQRGGRAAFEARLVLAATLAASYGIYGPAFELLEHVPREPGSEEYLQSEKYEVRHWDLDRPDSLAPLVRRVNRIRRDHPALQSNDSLTFHPIDDPAMLAYTKRDPATDDLILTIVLLDGGRPGRGSLELPLAGLGLDPDRPVRAENLLDGSVHRWHGEHQTIELDPADCPAAIYHLRPELRTEAEFEPFA